MEGDIVVEVEENNVNSYMKTGEKANQEFRFLITFQRKKGRR
jgi:hypothetical protein